MKFLTVHVIVMPYLKPIKLLMSLLMFVCMGLTSHAQQAPSSSGGDAAGFDGTASYSVGQVTFTSVYDNLGSVNQGVQQAYTVHRMGRENREAFAKVFPNPTSSTVTLELSDTMDLQDLTYDFLSLDGRLIMSNAIDSELTTIHTENLAAGIYFLRIYDPNDEIETFKIIKN